MHLMSSLPRTNTLFKGIGVGGGASLGDDFMDKAGGEDPET